MSAVTHKGDLASLDSQVKLALCRALESEGCWENLAHGLGLGILNTAFRLSPSPTKTLLDSYEVLPTPHGPGTRRHGSEVLFALQVSGGTVRDLLTALRAAGGGHALSVLEEALQETPTANQTKGGQWRHGVRVLPLPWRPQR